MSLYGETKARVFAVALSVADLKTRSDNLEDMLEKIMSKVVRNRVLSEVLDKQLEGLFQHIRDNFSDEEVAMIGKEDETPPEKV